MACVLLVALSLRFDVALEPPCSDVAAAKVDGSNTLELRSPQFVYRLDTADGLRGESWENRLTGKTVSLGKGPEVELDFDAAERWIPITGWRTSVSQSRPSATDDDQGFRAGWFWPEFNDSAWRPIMQPALRRTRRRERARLDADQDRFARRCEE